MISKDLASPCIAGYRPISLPTVPELCQRSRFWTAQNCLQQRHFRDSSKFRSCERPASNPISAHRSIVQPKFRWAPAMP